MAVNKHYISPSQLLADAFQLGWQVYASGFRPGFILAVWRGGTPVGVAVHELLDLLGVKSDHLAIRTTSYTGIGQRDDTVRVDGTITIQPCNEWDGSADTSWNNSDNWTNNTVPNGIGDVANFLQAIAGPSVAAVNSDVTVGTINFDRSSSYTIAGPEEISLQTVPPGGSYPVSVWKDWLEKDAKWARRKQRRGS